MLRNIKSFNAPEIEEKVLAFWDKKNIFKKSLKPKKGKKEKIFNFWEGPPYANGRPGIHHMLARAFKDVFLRYKTMKGFVVPRRAGWDTHGLPIELAAEKALGISTKKEIEEVGVEKFNEKAKESIFKYKDEWEKFTHRIGYWLDFKNAYVTYKPNFVESLWWVFSQVRKNGYLKEFYKVSPYCPRCQTTLSSHELGQPGVYQEVEDPSIFIKFPVKGKKNEYLLVWTTTPWTLSANVAIAVSENIIYKKYKVGKDILWAYNIPERLIDGVDVSVLEEKSGKELVGLEYEPLFKLPKDINLPIKLYTVQIADFVSTEEGTGLVHIAPSFGDDDFKLVFKDGMSEEYKIPHTVMEDGKVIKGFIGEGLFVKDADAIVLEDLEKRGLLFANERAKHEYPHCWRCNSPLIYSAQKSWFFEMSRLRKELVKSNSGVNWVPDYLKDGRFGEWISKARDWSISRQRFWGTPLPIWRCEKCNNIKVVGGLEDLNDNSINKNNFFIARHGEADANVGNWIASGEDKGDKISHLTPKGIKQAESIAKKIKKENIDIIIASPYERTKETAKIIQKETNAKLVFDKKLEELKVSKLNGLKLSEYENNFDSLLDRFNKSIDGIETLSELRERAYDAIRTINKKYQNSNILIVSHGDVLWMLESSLKHIEFENSNKIKYMKTGEFRSVKLDNYPTDKYGIIDIHRPYVDDVNIKCESCGGPMNRIPDVADVWFDSGSMPYASIHFPFDKNSIAKNTTNGAMPKAFPADFISEGIDQTRGWFYTLMAVSSLLKLGTPYKNVVSLGLVLDKNGKKMSKSRGNVVDPWDVVSKSGADSARWYFYTITSPAEPKNFDQQEVVKTFRRFVLMIYNSYAFLNLYGKKGVSLNPSAKNKNIMDEWILARTKQASVNVGVAMESYDAMKSCQEIEKLVEDLSRWYIRRSRRRFQDPENKTDLSDASSVLAHSLLIISKLIAPFMPFFAEALYQSLASDYKFDSRESVHLDDWPEFGGRLPISVIENMERVRSIASDVLSERSDAGIKVRQPLASLTLRKKSKAKLSKSFLDVLKEEINVKKVVYSDKIKKDFVLDIELTPELEEEGVMREFVRSVQGLRQNAHYVPSDVIRIWVKSNDFVNGVIEKNIDIISKRVGAKNVIIGDVKDFDVDIDTKINGVNTWIGIKKL